jgi:hypothetical protein
MTPSNLDALNIFFGLITVLAFLFVIYEYFEARSKAKIEDAKVTAQLQRISHAKHSMVSSLETADAIVQRSKDASVTVAELQTLARVARSQLIVLLRELENEEENLSKWKYGRVWMSQKPDVRAEKKRDLPKE